MFDGLKLVKLEFFGPFSSWNKSTDVFYSRYQ